MKRVVGFPHLGAAEARAASESRSTGRKVRVVLRDSGHMYGFGCTFEVWPYDDLPDGKRFLTWLIVHPRAGGAS